MANSLKTQVEADLKKAMLAKDKDALKALRAIKSLILLEETKEGGSGELTREDEIKLLNKAAKQRRESAEIFRQQNRLDLAAAEEAELKIIEQYLPKQLSEEELTSIIQAMIAEVGATSPADLGKVMAIATKQLAGQADGKIIAATVKSLLAR